MYKNAEEMQESLTKCYEYFVSLRKPFTYEIEGTGIRFKVGSKEMFKDFGDLPQAQWYLCVLNIMFEQSSEVGTKTTGRKYAVFPKHIEDLQEKEKNV